MLERQSKTLRELHELVGIISVTGPEKRKGLSLDVLRRSPRPFAKLYRSLVKDSNLNESGALKALTVVVSGESSVTREPGLIMDKSRFNRVKSDLKSRLLDTLFLLDLGNAGYSDYSLTLFAVNRTMFLARTLVALGARDLSESLAKSGIAKAMLVEEWSAAMEFLFILRGTASQAGDAKAYQFYMSEYLQCQRLLAAEHEAESRMEQLQLGFARRGGELPSHAAFAENAADRVDELAATYPSFKLSFLAIRLRAAAAQLRMDHRTSLGVCSRAFALLDRYPQFSNPARRAEYAITMLVSAGQLKDTPAAEKAIQECNRYLTSRKNNWFIFKEYEYLYLMRTLRFDEARALIRSIFSHDRFNLQSEAAKEKWGLFRLYAEYVGGDRVPVKTPADVGALIPMFAADKTGFNTSMVLLHVLLLARREQFAEMRDRMEFIKGYRKRHLKGPENTHAAHFFTMLALIDTCDLNYRKIVSRSANLLRELKRMESEESIQGELILPYSYMWQQILEALQAYHHLSHR